MIRITAVVANLATKRTWICGLDDCSVSEPGEQTGVGAGSAVSDEKVNESAASFFCYLRLLSVHPNPEGTLEDCQTSRHAISCITLRCIGASDGKCSYTNSRTPTADNGFFLFFSFPGVVDAFVLCERANRDLSTCFFFFLR